MMKGYDAEAAKRFILDGLDPKAFRAIRQRLPQIVEELITYDLHYMRVTGVLDENGEMGENEYDDDEAFEYIYDAWLGDHPNEDDEDMTIAAVLNEYMELQYRFLCENGLAEL